MPKENDLEGQQDQGGKHGGQKGMPKSPDRPSPDHGIARDRQREERPRDKDTGRGSRQDRGDDPAGDKPAP